MRPGISAVLAIGLLVACLAEVGRADVTEEKTRGALDRAVRYLKLEQSEDGSWSDFPAHPGGVTALCALALLKSGVAVEDGSVQRALEHLRSLGAPERTYVVALQTMVFCAGAPNGDLALIRRNVKWLESAQVKGNRKNARRGAWSYGPRLGGGDGSNTRFALLALDEAERAGVKAGRQTWHAALDYWLRTQQADGSWGYIPGLRSSGSMTCAGIASVVIASQRVADDPAAVRRARRSLDKALGWLGKSFSAAPNPASPHEQAWRFYYLHTAERAGRLTGRKQFGDHDWHAEGAQRLLAAQDLIDGRWIGGGQVERNPLIATSFAVLFLASKPANCRRRL